MKRILPWLLLGLSAFAYGQDPHPDFLAPWVYNNRTMWNMPFDNNGYYNVLVGPGAGLNAVIPPMAKSMLTCVGHNTCGGAGAGLANSGANVEDTGLGWSAGSLWTTGVFNTAVGTGSQRNETTGANLVSVGADSMGLSNGSGQSVALGVNSDKNGTSSGVVAIGHAALQGAAGLNVANTVAIGYQSLLCAVCVSPNANVSIGFNAMSGTALTSPTNNVAIGYQSLSNNTATAIAGNVAVGYLALQNATNNYNVAIGANSGQAIAAGSHNTTIGSCNTAPALASGGTNILIGFCIDALSVGTSNEINIGGVVVDYITAPTVTSGGGTSPTVTATGTSVFKITEGTGSPTTTLVLGMPTAPTDWVCTALDRTSTTITGRQSGATSTTTVTITFSAAPTAADVIQFQCGAM